MGRHPKASTAIGSGLIVGASYLATGSLIKTVITSAIAIPLTYFGLAHRVTTKIPDPYNNVFVTGCRKTLFGNFVVTGTLFVENADGTVVAYKRQFNVAANKLTGANFPQNIPDNIQYPMGIADFGTCGPYWNFFGKWTPLKPTVTDASYRILTNPDCNWYLSMLQQAGGKRISGSIQGLGGFKNTLSPEGPKG